MKEKEIRIERFETLASTNDYAKDAREGGESLIVIAKRQTGGRGTKGRSFESEEGGLYLSKLDFYERLPAKAAFRIMENAATAVCEALATFGITARIKWPNDILVDGKKICGILIENTLSGAFVRSSVVGIGLNVHNRLSEDLQTIATTMQTVTGRTYSVAEVEKRLLKALSDESVGKKYRQYLGFVGEEVTLLCGESRITAVLLGVDDEGNLLVKTADGEKKFSTTEVSLRG